MKKNTPLIIAAAVSLLAAGCSKHGNQALYDYLGNPVAPPPSLDAAYTKEGLTSAVQAAAQAANVKLKKVEIDDSEFPFLVGVVCETSGGMDKLDGQLHKAGYQDSESYRGGAACVMNITPRSAYPTRDSSQIDHRLAPREAVFYKKLTSNP